MTDTENRDRTYLHAPFLNPADYLRAKAYLVGPVSQPRPRVDLRPAMSSYFEQLVARDKSIAVAVLEEWEECGFLPTERDVWIEYGLGRYDARIAEDCRRHRLPPPALAFELDGRTVAEHLQKGTPARVLVARLRAESA